MENEIIGKPSTKSKNALVHGFYASEMLLPWEERDDLLELHKALRAEWDPKTPTEEEVVVDLLRLFLHKRRAQRSAQIMFHSEPYAQEIAESGLKSWPQIRAFVKEQGKEIDVTRVSLVALLKTFRSTAKELMKSDTDLGKRAELTSSMEGIRHLMEDTLKLKEKIDALKSHESVFEDAYHPDRMEKIIRVEAMIDARIDKTLADEPQYGGNAGRPPPCSRCSLSLRYSMRRTSRASVLSMRASIIASTRMIFSIRSG